MSGVTDADREHAKVLRLTLGKIAGSPLQEALIAAALAEERQRARAPFLALADEYDSIWHESAEGDPVEVMIATGFRASANDIRRAVETQPAGVWVAFYYDGSAFVPFATEIEAYRHANSYSMQVKFVRYGDAEWMHS